MLHTAHVDTIEVYQTSKRPFPTPPPWPSYPGYDDRLGVSADE
jgi:hypothetical protein